MQAILSHWPHFMCEKKIKILIFFQIDNFYQLAIMSLVYHYIYMGSFFLRIKVENYDLLTSIFYILEVFYDLAYIVRKLLPINKYFFILEVLFMILHIHFYHYFFPIKNNRIFFKPSLRS